MLKWRRYIEMPPRFRLINPRHRYKQTHTLLTQYFVRLSAFWSFINGRLYHCSFGRASHQMSTGNHSPWDSPQTKATVYRHRLFTLIFTCPSLLIFSSKDWEMQTRVFIRLNIRFQELRVNVLLRKITMKKVNSSLVSLVLFQIRNSGPSKYYPWLATVKRNIQTGDILHIQCFNLHWIQL